MFTGQEVLCFRVEGFGREASLVGSGSKFHSLLIAFRGSGFPKGFWKGFWGFEDG